MLPPHIENGADSLHWCTPEVLLNPIRSFFGGAIGLDPCSNAGSIVNARVEYCLPTNDGLKDPWDVDGPGTTAFCNPPFGRCWMNDARDIIGAKERKEMTKEQQALYPHASTVSDWAKKAAWEWKRNGCETIMLIPACVDTAMFHETIFPTADSICFIKGRVRFLGKVSGPAPMPTCLVYWGTAPIAFADTFSTVGAVLALR